MDVKKKTYPMLFEPGSIGTLKLRNRVIMGIYPTHYPVDSQVTERMIGFYGARARGGAAMIVVEAPCLDYPRAYFGGAQPRLDEDRFLPGLRRLTESIHEGGAKAFIQLNYPAAIGSGANRVSFVDGADGAELRRVAASFGDGAYRVREAGFDGVEVQAAWGQMASLLLSPASNQRVDEFGGSLANRARFLLACVAAIREAVGRDFPIQVKLAVRHFVPGGFDVPEALEVAKMLEEAGIDSLLISAGADGKSKRWGQPSQTMRPALLAPLAAEIKRVASIPVVAAGKIKRPELAEEILQSGQADFIALTRPLIADPEWPNKVRDGRVEEIRGCIFCLQDCSGHGVPGLGRACTVNPYTGREKETALVPATKSKKVVIIGGGPAGLQAAITSAERGHSVLILEKENRLGGIFALPQIGRYKGDVAELPRYLEHRARQLGVQIKLGVDVSSNAESLQDSVLSEAPEVVVVATGAQRFIPDYPGADGANVIEAMSIWTERAQAGRRVAIVGAGSVACELGEWLRDHGSEVTIQARRAEILKDMKEGSRSELLDRLVEKKINILTKVQVARIEPNGLAYRDENGTESFLPVDTVILAAGARPDPRLVEQLQGKVAEVYAIGDCDQPGTGGAAIRAGLEIGMRL